MTIYIRNSAVCKQSLEHEHLTDEKKRAYLLKILFPDILAELCIRITLNDANVMVR